MKVPDEELDIHTEQDEEGFWVCRIFHRPSGTIKISHRYEIRDQAIDEARNELLELLRARRDGLGSKNRG